METKRCGRCKRDLPVSDFSKDKHQKKDGLNNKCRACCQEVWQAYSQEKIGSVPFSENKNCSQFLGIHVAERLLRHLFKDVQPMPLHNQGYDFICNKGFKVDAKSSVAICRTAKGRQWQFDINNNQIADYFLCVAFNTREDLTPLHLWLVPGKEINHLHTASIGVRSLGKWSAWEKPIDKVITCCDALKTET